MLTLQISQRDILNSIEREMSGDLKMGFKCIGKIFYNYFHFFGTK